MVDDQTIEPLVGLAILTRLFEVQLDAEAALVDLRRSQHDKMRAAPGLKQKDYFRNPQLDVESILNKMVEKKVFGIDCIGFISQYLVYAGVWQDYKPYYPARSTPFRTNTSSQGRQYK